MLSNFQKNRNLPFGLKIDVPSAEDREHICANSASAGSVFGNGHIKENYRESLRPLGKKKEKHIW